MQVLLVLSASALAPRAPQRVLRPTGAQTNVCSDQRVLRPVCRHCVKQAQHKQRNNNNNNYYYYYYYYYCCCCYYYYHYYTRRARGGQHGRGGARSGGTN